MHFFSDLCHKLAEVFSYFVSSKDHRCWMWQNQHCESYAGNLKSGTKIKNRILWQQEEKWICSQL